MATFLIGYTNVANLGGLGSAKKALGE